MPHAATCTGSLADGLARSAAGCARAPLASVLAITTDDALARGLGERSRCCGENLEGAAVGLACAAAGVPFAALLACTNEVGSRGRAQWAGGHRAAAQATAAALLAWLAAGAPNLPPA
jgi:nucleoside phosphorylase